ncbi:MAG: hypothetical protein KGN36_13195 [Acidobacteriota bacterium]|nr:hypothetical protein [Acidobacteriota bacterium]
MALSGIIDGADRGKYSHPSPAAPPTQAKTLVISEEAKKIAWKAQQWLHKRYKAMAVRDKNKNQIVTAIGRELLGFIWAIAVETEKPYRLAKAA